MINAVAVTNGLKSCSKSVEAAAIGKGGVYVAVVHAWSECRAHHGSYEVDCIFNCASNETN